MIMAAQPVARAAGNLSLGVLAVGADGYTAALSWGDLSPMLARRPAIVAWREDGNLLPRPRLVVPDDINGARYVKQLTELRVVPLTD
ncbi:molybdopterin-binding protein [Mycolicibacterium rutilum]|nr:hypothetical protein [Mycolicibacterium rutilum]